MILSIKGDIIWTGRLEWTHDEDSIEYIDVPQLDLGVEERSLLVLRNGSPTVDVKVYVGHMYKAHPSGAVIDKTWSLGSTGSNTVFENTAHGLKVGDALECVTAGGTNCTAGTIYYVHGADAATAVPANTLYLSLTRAEGGALIDATNTTAGTFRIAEEFAVLTDWTLGKWAAESTTAIETGNTSEIIDTWPYASKGGRIKAIKSAVTAGNFNVYLEIRRA